MVEQDCCEKCQNYKPKECDFTLEVNGAGLVTICSDRTDKKVEESTQRFMMVGGHGSELEARFHDLSQGSKIKIIFLENGDC